MAIDVRANPDHRFNAMTQLMADLTALFVGRRKTALFQLHFTESESRCPPDGFTSSW